MCDQCKHTHSFVSTRTMFYVCPVCFSVIERGIDHAVSKPRESFRVEEDMSLLQLGTQVSYEGSDFTVIGRYQYFLNSCVRNKWVMRNMQDDFLFLMEEAGFYTICQKHSRNLSNHQLSLLAPEYEYLISEKTSPVFLECMYRNTATRMEGELIGIDEDGMEFIAADFTNASGDYVFVQVFTKKSNTVYVGKYFDFKELKIKQHRLGDGWK